MEIMDQTSLSSHQINSQFHPMNTRQSPPLYALVTGANRGLGFECCRLLADHGIFVFLSARNHHSARDAATQLNNGKRQIMPITLDVDDPDQQRTAFELISKTSGGCLDLLVNNAAIYPDKPTDSLNDAITKLAATLQTNTIAPLQLISLALPLLSRSPNPRIVNVSSRLGTFTQTANPTSPSADAKSLAYQTSKAALNMATNIVAKYIADSGIHLLSVSPGWCRTDMGSENATHSAAEGATTIVNHLLHPPINSHGKLLAEDGTLPW